MPGKIWLFIFSVALINLSMCHSVFAQFLSASFPSGENKMGQVERAHGDDGKILSRIFASKTKCSKSADSTGGWYEVSCAGDVSFFEPNIRTNMNSTRSADNYLVGENILTGGSVLNAWGVDSGAYSGSYPFAPISWAEGSFFNVNVKNITDSSGGMYSANIYSLQLNTNKFFTPVCDGAKYPPCQGWMQFVYLNQFTNNGLQGVIYIYYMLLGYGGPCPSGWLLTGINCAKGSGFIWIPPVAPADFGKISLVGQIEDGTDSLIFGTGDSFYRIDYPSVFPGLTDSSSLNANSVNYDWSVADFNVYGFGGGSIANFNSGASLGVRTVVNTGTADAPQCLGLNPGGTAESHNLIYGSACCAYGGGRPSIAFIEDNIGNATSMTCDSIGSVTITPSSAANGTISPSLPIVLPKGAAERFTLTPYPYLGYQISTVTGCNGSLNGNVYTTGPAVSDCTISATFTRPSPIIDVPLSVNRAIQR